MKTMQTFSISVALGLIFTTLALAGPGRGFGPGEGPGHEQRLENMAVMLDLTEDQQKSIQEILDKSRVQAEASRAQFQQNRKAMQAIEQADIFDRDKARELAYRMADNWLEMMAEKHRVRQQIDALLTAEQLEKKSQLQTLRAQHREQRQARVQDQRHPNTP